MAFLCTGKRLAVTDFASTNSFKLFLFLNRYVQILKLYFILDKMLIVDLDYLNRNNFNENFILQL